MPDEITITIHGLANFPEASIPLWLSACLAEHAYTGALVRMPAGALLVSNRELTPAEMAHAEALLDDPELQAFRQIANS